MALQALRPTGNRILTSDVAQPTFLFPQDYHSYWLNSGTAALALALIAAKTSHPTKTPEVILPTYGCPDLVAAAQYAGVRAILVDIQARSPQFDYQQLEAAISSNTVAIVAATLLGIRADEKSLRTAIGNRPITLIEDSAQWFPRDSSQTFFGDYVVLSFGRGKPVNVLGGGALLTSTQLPEPVTNQINLTPQSSGANVKYQLRTAIYNALIHPAAYGVAEKLPFLHIGETVFHALTQIAEIPAQQKQRLSSNLTAFTQRNLNIQHRWRAALIELNDSRILDLCQTHAVSGEFSLLRYPLLIQSSTLRDQLYSQLRRQGLGASIMYAVPLMKIPGVSPYAALFSGQNHAEIFSGELLTLPTHDDVSTKTVADTMAIFKKILTQTN